MSHLSVVYKVYTVKYRTVRYFLNKKTFENLIATSMMYPPLPGVPTRTVPSRARFTMIHSGSSPQSMYLHGIAGDVTSALLESLAEVGVRTQVQRGLALLVLDAQVRPVGSYSNNKSTFTLKINL